MLSTLSLGVMTDRIPRGHAAGLVGLFVVGGLFGLAAVVMLKWADLPVDCNNEQVQWTDVRTIGRERPFLRCMLAISIYNIPFYFACPYYTVFALEELHMRPSMVACMMIGYYGIKSLISFRMGGVVDRLGARLAIYLISPLYLLFFLLYAVSTSHTAWLIFLAWSMVSLADAVFNIAAVSALYRTIPETSARQTFFAVYNLLAFLSASVGAVSAAASLQALRKLTITVGPWTLDHFHLLYLGCFLLLIPSCSAPSSFPHANGK